MAVYSAMDSSAIKGSKGTKCGSMQYNARDNAIVQLLYVGSKEDQMWHCALQCIVQLL